MGIMDNLIDQVKSIGTDQKVEKERIKISENRLSSGTADEILTDDDEVTRLSRYIAEKFKKRVFDIKSAIKNGVEKIGTFGDNRQILPELLAGAKKSSKEYAAKILVNQWAADNLKDKIVVKGGKEIIGKIISKNIYIKKVEFMRAGKLISYLQARNKLTGRVVSYKTASKLLARS